MTLTKGVSYGDHGMARIAERRMREWALRLEPQRQRELVTNPSAMQDAG
jgi:hypothetical protein